MDMSDLDRDVATKVMMWHESDSDGVPCWLDADNVAQAMSFTPSTDEADAWRVLDRFVRVGFEVSVHSECGEWYCVVMDKYVRKYAEERDASRTTAICRAALAAITKD